MYKHSFFYSEQRRTKEENKAFILSTDKPLQYTYGLGYRHPTTDHKPITKEEALKIIDEHSLLDIDEYEDYVHLNAYSDNDMW